MPRLVEILFFAGCPHTDQARNAVRAALEQLRLAEAVEVREIEVHDAGHARQLRFLGSPSVRVGGRDVEPSADRRNDFGMQCRVYRAGDEAFGAPPAAWVAASLLRHCKPGAADE
ncbi:MAG TPA: hypothetical protein VF331_00420 [Polyangiales bacterium]